MKELYFNVYEFEQIKKLMNTDPQSANERFQEYILKYPLDYRAKTYYASNLIILGELEQAGQVIDDVEFEVANDKKIINDKNSTILKFYRQNITYTKIRLLFYQGKYQELYDVYFNSDNFNIFGDNIDDYLNVDLGYFNYEALSFYVKKQLGLIPEDINTYSFTYLYKQIMDYHDEIFLEHIKKHMADVNVELDVPNRSIFKYDFPVNMVFMELKKYIPSDRCLYSGLVQDLYVFKYDNCGWDNKKMVDYFKVICFHDTCEFITMCPAKDCQYLPYVDLNYMNVNIDNDNKKVKRKSQIDKFNQRFGIK